MNCCYSKAAEEHFDEAHAHEDLLRYRRNGPDATTRLLLDMLKAGGLIPYVEKAGFAS